MREKEVKKWRRAKKINLIKTENLEMKDLSIELLKDIDEEELKKIIPTVLKTPTALPRAWT